MVALLARARYLTTTQVHQMFFDGCDESYSRKRLGALAGFEGKKAFSSPYLRRLGYRTYDGEFVTAWALTDLGYLLASTILGEELRPPAKDVSSAYMEHAIAVSDLFVGAVRPHLTAGCTMARLPFQWHPTDTVRLPWHEYEPQAPAPRARLIVPDAVLALPGAARRWFIECEMGTHSIQAASDEKAGATLAKAERYEEFFAGYADAAQRTTFYTAAYPDGWPAEVVFLVRNASRRSSVNEALRRWVAGRPGRPLSVKAMLLDEALAALGELVPAARPSRSRWRQAPPDLQLTRDEASVLRSFYQEALRQLDAAGAVSGPLRELAQQARPILVRLASPSRTA